jgi:hypothetical protein
MLRSFSARIALLILLPTALIQAQNLLPNPEFHTQASLLTAYSSSVNPPETQPDPTSEGFYRSDFTKSPAVKSSNAQPQVASTSVRPFSKVGVGFNVGFLGIGAEIATPLHQRGNLRVSGNAFQYSAPFNTNGFDVDATFKVASVRVAYDFLPFAGSFHISPLLMAYNGNNFGGTVTVQPQNSVTINNTVYFSNAADPIKGTPSVTFSKVVPGFTIGWGNLIPRGEHSHISFPFEIGGVYSGQPKVNMNLTGTACNASGTSCKPVATDPGIQANIAAQQNTYISDYSWLRFYPIVQFGIGYKF